MSKQQRLVVLAFEESGTVFEGATTWLWRKNVAPKTKMGTFLSLSDAGIVRWNNSMPFFVMPLGLTWFGKQVWLFLKRDP